MHHLTLRVAWHDSCWNGSVCQQPSDNSFCVALDRIRESKEDEKEDLVAGHPWCGLSEEQLPPCTAESGGFMSENEWIRVARHPYQAIKAAESTHGHLLPTSIKVSPYATFAVPFAWMLKKNQNAIDQALPKPLPPDEKSPFNSAWVFGRARQEALVSLFFGRLVPERSLVFFYCKEGQPLGDILSRLIVGVGRIVTIDKIRHYEHEGGTPYPMWDRLVRHSIRPDGEEGFLLPYHDYLQPTGNPEEDERRLALLPEIAVPVESAHVRTFSYAAELAPPDTTLSTLVRCLEAVRRIREHGIAKGPWERREEWLNAQIAATWKDRGPFPGLGSALEAVGMRLGTALSLELFASGTVDVEEDPWPIVDAILRGARKPPQAAYQADLEAVRATWVNLSEERRALLLLLSRFALTPGQAKRWFDPTKRAGATRYPVSDQIILENPYCIAETDLGDAEEGPISVGQIDRGLVPDSTIGARFPVPSPSAVGSPGDARRLRGALISVLRQAAEQGDALLSTVEAIDRVRSLDLVPPCEIGPDWLQANEPVLSGTVDRLDVMVRPQESKAVPALQLSELRGREERLAKILRARAGKALPSLGEDWSELVEKAIKEAGGSIQPDNPRHQQALIEQAQALEQITTHRLGVLVGRAGTGKTSVLGALLQSTRLIKDGVLFLAPTGKARVHLGMAVRAEAMTVAQFLWSCQRYDGTHQRPLFAGGDRYQKEKTIVIDECSMLTMDDLAAVLEALDLAHVQRLILVGDPNQLPPIGVGRPFADLAAFLERAGQATHSGALAVGGALARLVTEVRSLPAPKRKDRGDKEGEEEDDRSDALRLASWFTCEPQPVDADRVLSNLELGEAFNDLEICFWQDAQELHDRLLEQFQKHLGLSGPDDVSGFNRALGLDENGWVPFDAPNGPENFQILSPVRMHPHGVHDLNRWGQQMYRLPKLKDARRGHALSLGDEEIVLRDKVIQVRNERRDAYDWSAKAATKCYVANGELGTVATDRNGWLNVVFAGRPNLTFGYRPSQFPGGSGPLELAYALTVHKAQGSEFRTVFVVLPKNCRLLSRELLYTALTRSRQRLVLLIEGTDASGLYDFTRPGKSETARRNTNLFFGAVRESGADEVPYAEHLIHRAEKPGLMVRSKSELVIANMLYRMGVEFEYERPVMGEVEPGKRRPDFSFVDPAGDLILWEHLGMMDREDYSQAWEAKQRWYEKNGYSLESNLFTTRDDSKGGLDSEAIRKIAERIQAIL